MLDVLEALGVSGDIRRGGAHLDPDLNAGATKRSAGWLPCFGQTGAAQTHLVNQGIGVGDIFLFYGWFRPTHYVQGILRYAAASQARHVLFGYLEIGAIVDLRIGPVPLWAHDHPHVVNACRSNNTLYVSTETASWNASLPGAGRFGYSSQLILSKSDRTTRVWSLPSCFDPGCGAEVMSRHRLSHYRTTVEDVEITTVAPGQEFVLNATSAIARWAKTRIEAGLQTAALLRDDVPHRMQLRSSEPLTAIAEQ